MSDYREDLQIQKDCAKKMIERYAKGHYDKSTTSQAEAKARVQTAKLKLAVIEAAIK